MENKMETTIVGLYCTLPPAVCCNLLQSSAAGFCGSNLAGEGKLLFESSPKLIRGR